MGIEQIKNNKGQQSLIFDKEDFVENDLLGDKIEDYTFLRIDNTGKYSYEAKVQSLTNNKIYRSYDVFTSTLLSTSLSNCQSSHVFP